ncbi:AT-rich interactive domain-containing protein 1B-like [Penaeus monodon]|uniref:AT-rich interactive domain-containing protein 1B-like n=1 Tax=Penaeus monodon TaxID=6687 RepID=UPI0018A73632|nr:AT-rich interactive domain-containing protein 1B-like [Penaeus monodon]
MIGAKDEACGNLPFLAVVCMVSAAKLPGYSARGDTGLGVDLGGAGGHGGGAAGAGSVFQAVFVGSGNLPASAIVGAGAGIGGGAVGQEYTGPSTGPVAPVDTVEEEYTGPVAAVSPVVTVEEEYTGPSTGPIDPVAPVIAVEEEYTGPSIDAGPVAAVSPVVTVDEEYNAPVAPVPTVMRSRPAKSPLSPPVRYSHNLSLCCRYDHCQGQ